MLTSVTLPRKLGALQVAGWLADCLAAGLAYGWQAGRWPGCGQRAARRLRRHIILLSRRLGELAGH